MAEETNQEPGRAESESATPAGETQTAQPQPQSQAPATVSSSPTQPAPPIQSTQPQQLAENPGVKKNKHLFAKITCCLGLIFLLFVGGTIFYIFRASGGFSGGATPDNRKVTYEMPNKVLTQRKNYKVAGVFVELPGDPMPNEFLETLCNPDQTDSYSYYHTPYWLKYQAANWGVDFNMEFRCVNKKIQVPDYFIAKTEKYVTCADGTKVKNRFDHFLEFEPWLRKTYPELTGYNYLMMTTYYGKDYQCPSHGSAAANIYQNTALVDIHKQYELADAKALFGEQAGKNAMYNPPLNSAKYPMAFAHEFLHLVGAIDKYLSWDQKKQSADRCATDKKTGQMYDLYDIMCGGSSYGPKEAKVTEYTAREVGWIK